MSVRVRFAPSPTGYLHVGGLRTALYNYLFAKHHNGKMILRIEDTDRTRFVDNAQENLVKSLLWAGIDFDESPDKGGDFGPYVQSERFDLYKENALVLIANGSAYYAFDTAEEIEAMRQRQQAAGIAPKYDRTTMRSQYTLGDEETKKLIAEGHDYVIRLKVPHDEVIRFKDIIRGEVVVHGKDVDDQILIKSDGFPTYHLANVVDDHFMQISHVIRGEEWLPSTPKHVILYKAFGWEHPEFAHLPLLLNDSKIKLSKRHGDVAVEDFVAKGYFKDAFVNFIALLGWNPTGDQEIFSMEDLIAAFNLEKVNKAGAVFDRRKLDWMNSQYLRSKPHGELADRIMPIMAEHNYNAPKEYVEKVIGLVKERITFAEEVPTFAYYMFEDVNHIEEEYFNKFWNENTENLIKPLFERFALAEPFDHDTLDVITKTYLAETNTKFGPLMNPVRLIITGKSVGASILDTMAILGKDKCMQRFNEFMTKYSGKYTL